MDYRAFVWDSTQLADSPDGDEVEVMLVEHVTNMLDIIESELQSVMEELMHIEGISEIDEAKTKLGKILDGLY
jgi:hypothetical protein